jgi:hypothetical protein
VKINLLENRQQVRLTLRKEKLEDRFMSKRLQFLNSYSFLEINPDKLRIRTEIIEYIPQSVEDIVSHIKNLLISNDYDQVKLGILKTRKFTVTNTDKGNYLVKYGVVDIFINIMETSNEYDVLV